MADITITGRIGRRDVSVRFTGPLTPSPNAALSVFLLQAMKEGEPLALDEPVSRRLLENAGAYQSIVSAWWPHLRRVPIEAPAHNDPPVAGDGTASFFSGGVDSFHTAIRCSADVTHLVFAHGFDIPLKDTSLRARAADAARRAADALGKPLVEIETDLRDTLDVPWEWYHGSALATAGHLLGLGAVLIPATHTYRDLFPWGSHPLLDPLWSTERVKFMHHGADATRFQKLATIAQSPAALENLRVCWENPGGAFNCGRCTKCLRTMVGLHLHGALDRCATLPPRLDRRAVGRLRPMDDNERTFVRENLAAAYSVDRRLAWHLFWSLRMGRIVRPAHRLLGRLRSVRLRAARLLGGTT